MSTAPNPRNSRTGAVPVGGSHNRRKWLLPLLFGLLALIAVLALLSQCGDDDDDDATDRNAGTPASAAATVTSTAAASSPTASDPTGGASTGTGQAGGPATVTAGGSDLLSAATAAELGKHDTQPAVGRAVKVQSVPADEGFWVGVNERDRLWVQLTGTGESDYKVKQGDSIDFTGTVTKAAQGYAAKTGVTAAEGADQLTQQGYYISAPSSSIKLSR